MLVTRSAIRRGYFSFICVPILLLSSCTGFEPVLRPGLTVQYLLPTQERNHDPRLGESDKPKSNGSTKPKSNPGEDDQENNKIVEGAKAYCMLRDREFGEPPNCLYQYIVIDDPKSVAGLDDQKDEKIKLIRTMISFSRTNCNTYMSRVFANREGLEFWQKLLGDFGSTAGSASAFATPYASVGISTATLVMNHGMDALKATYYQGAQVPLEIAIYANRMHDEKIILDRLNNPESYSIMNALADINDLDLDCSIDRGIQFLTNAAQSQAQGGNMTMGRLEKEATIQAPTIETSERWPLGAR